jgi:hypothetical protein
LAVLISFTRRGSYDYLNDKVATRLLQALFGLLKKGGKIWIANFLPDIPDRAFMESIMDWWLVYRTPEQMRQLAEPCGRVGAPAVAPLSSTREYCVPGSLSCDRLGGMEPAQTALIAKTKVK